MAHPLYGSEEIARRGKALYEERIRPLVETEDNLGKIVSIDIETGDYRVDSDIVRASDALHAARPGAAVWSERIGYDAVYALGGGSLTRASK